MHFLFLTFEFPPDHGGGLATYMGQACQALSDAGHQVTVITTNLDGADRKTEMLYGATVISFPIDQHFAFDYMGRWPAISYAISDELKLAIEMHGRPDLVEVCDGFALGYFSMLRRLTLEEPFVGLKFLVTAHTPCSLIWKWNGKENFELTDYWLEMMEEWCFLAADKVQVPSQFLIGKLRSEWGLKNTKLELLPNPFKVSTLKPMLPASQRLYACVISRVTKWKGIPNLVLSFDQLWSKGETLGLRVYGTDTRDEETGQMLITILSETYADRIESGLLVFAGKATPEELVEVRNHAEFQIHPSENENFPYTVIEAMAAGTVVIANSNGGQSELITNGKSGFLYQADEPASLEKIIKRYRQLSDKQRVNLCELARKRISEYCNPVQYAAAKENSAVEIQKIPFPDQFPFLRGKQVSCKKFKGTGRNQLTVIIPYYNMHEFVEESIDSVYASTIPVEVILVNDGSTAPETEATLKRMKEKYPSLSILNKSNSGVAETRNIGVEVAQTEYVALLDSDDLVEPTYYQESLAILEKYKNVSFVGCWSNDYDEKGTIRYWTTFSPEPPLHMIANMVNCQALILRRSAFLEAGQHDPKLLMFLDDWEATIGLICAGYRGVMIPRPLFNYRIRPNSIFRSLTPKWDKHFNYIVEKHKESFAEYAPEIIKFLNVNGPGKFYHNPTHPSRLVGLLANSRQQNWILHRFARVFYCLKAGNEKIDDIKLSWILKMPMKLIFRVLNSFKKPMK